MKSVLAMPADAEAMPPKPNKPAISARMRNDKAQRSPA